jgi:hypothetical protein
MQERQLPTPGDPAPTGRLENGHAGTGAAFTGSFEGNAPQPLAPPAAAEAEEAAPQRIPRWLQQAERFLRVIVRMYLGLLVCLAPWYPQAWDGNPLFVHSPELLQFVSQGWVRGVVSGLGLLNLWIALLDAIQGSREAGGK